MVLNRIYILPHGDEIIDLPDEGSRVMAETIKNTTMGDDSDVLVIASPHGVKLSRNIAVVNTERFHGVFDLKTRKLERSFINERILSESIIAEAEDSEEVSFVTSHGDKSLFPLDFGTLIPLEFFTDRPLVYLGQSRITDRARLRRFGRDLYGCLEKYNGKVSLIISADQAHTHSDKGPYGYSAEAATYEEIVIKAIKNNEFSGLLSVSEEMISKARPDSFWNLIVLSSILEESGKKLVLDYHYVEEYFGMICAHSH